MVEPSAISLQRSAYALLLINAPHVATQKGTAYVSGIFQASADGKWPPASTVPWLIATKIVPTTSAVRNDRRSRGAYHSVCRRHRGSPPRTKPQPPSSP